MSNDLEKAELRTKVLKLRRGGMNYREIADALTEEGNKVTASTAKRWVQDALSALGELEIEEADALRAQENDRLDRMLLSIWPQAQGGSIPHINTALKLMERRAKMLALDKKPDEDPQKHEVMVLPSFFAGAKNVETNDTPEERLRLEGTVDARDQGG